LIIFVCLSVFTRAELAVIKTKQNWFVVKHFAGPVGYSSDNFLDKNKDQLSVDVVNIMKNSQND
jgi:myosin heavy subunit